MFLLRLSHLITTVHVQASSRDICILRSSSSQQTSVTLSTEFSEGLHNINHVIRPSKTDLQLQYCRFYDTAYKYEAVFL